MSKKKLYQITEVETTEVSSEKDYSMLEQFLQAEREANNEFRKMMLDSFTVLAKLVANRETITTNVSPVEVTNAHPVEAKAEPVIPVVQSVIFPRSRKSYKVYERKIKEICNEIASISGCEDRKAILAQAYRELDKQYGICLAQVNVDFSKKYGGRAKSTLEVMYDLEKSNPACTNLLYSKLQTFLAEEKAKVKITFPIANIYELERMSDYIVKATNNKSQHGCSFYRKYYCYLYKYTTIEWNKRREEIREKYKYSPSARINIRDIIKEYPEIQKEAIDCYNKFIEECYPEFSKKIS